MGTDVAVVSNSRARQDNRELPNSGAISDGRRPDLRERVDERWLTFLLPRHHFSLHSNYFPLNPQFLTTTYWETLTKDS